MIKKRPACRQAGFTIIELLVFMGILSVFLVVLTQIFQQALDIQLESTGSSGVDLTSNYVLHRLEHDVRRAASITTPASVGQTSPSLALVIGGATYTYALAGTTLTLTNDLGTFALTDPLIGVTDLSVTRRGSGTGNDSLSVSFTLTSVTITTAGTPQTRQVNTTISLR